VLWGVLLTAITELLSLFRQITFSAVLGLWLLSLVVAVVYYLRLRGRGNGPSIRSRLATLSHFDRSLLGGLALISAVIAIIAWLAPPNNWDSLTYHMSRVAHWIQNKTVANYPTNLLRQLHQNPQAEFTILNFQILAGSDRVANLVQWFSMVGSMVGVSLLAKQLGASLRGQIFAAVVAGTIPMGILQGSSTQNDYVVAFWLVCFVYYAMLLKADGELLYALATGASLGLAILTKGTAYLYAFPFTAWVGLALIRSRHAKGFALIAVIVATSLVINAGHYARNYELYGSPMGPGQEGGSFRYSNDAFTISSAASNVVRNVGLHAGTPFKQVNAVLENGIYKLHKAIGVDPNDPRTTWPRTEFRVRRLSNHEDLAGNPLHLVLIVVCLPFLLLRRNNPDARYYSICLLAAFLLFSVYLKWQPWHSRLQLPLFVLWSPVVGLMVAETRYRRLANVIVVTLIVAAVPWLVYNSSRPLIGERSIITTRRDQQYFANRPSLFQAYDRSAQFLSSADCSDIGLVSGGDDWEYPFWVLLGEHERHQFRLEHVNVRNTSRIESSKPPFKTFVPCAVIVVGGDRSNELRVGNASYLLGSFTDPVGVFVRE
jgi:4-amino-4-deoxy-L-arabinose transferase-like glycosyltransferase